METTRLGTSDLNISRLGFGCWQLGGYGWQGLDHTEIETAVLKAIDQGVTLFDTADVYGLGSSEERLGRLIPKSRDDIVIASKFGVRIDDNGRSYYDNSRDWIFKAVEGSLKRLHRDCIDLYQLHWHTPERPLDEIFEDLETLRTQGKIKYYGVSNVDLVHDWGGKPYPKALASFSFEYNLCERKWEDQVNTLERDHKLSFLSWGSLAQGLLSGKYRKGHRFDKKDHRSSKGYYFRAGRWEFNESLLELMQDLSVKYDRSLPQIAIRWILDSHPDAVALIGIKTLDNLSDNMGSIGWSLAPEDLQKLDTQTQDMRYVEQRIKKGF